MLVSFFILPHRNTLVSLLLVPQSAVYVPGLREDNLQFPDKTMSGPPLYILQVSCASFLSPYYSVIVGLTVECLSLTLKYMLNEDSSF